MRFVRCRRRRQEGHRSSGTSAQSCGVRFVRCRRRRQKGHRSSGIGAPHIVEGQTTATVCLEIASQRLIEKHADAVIVPKTLATFLDSAASRAARVGSQRLAAAVKIIVVGVRAALDPTHVAVTPSHQPAR